MALTYDLELNEVGVGVTSVTDITTSDYALTGLNSESDYQIRVRAVETITGVEYPSIWSAWVDFTTLVTLADIIAALGTITNSQAIHAITTAITVPEVVVETFDLELTENGQSPVVITDIATNSHTLTGLTADTNYSVRVRHVKTVNGGVMQSLWSGATAFTATASLSDIVATLGTIANSQTLHPVTTSIADPLSPVVAQVGTINNSQTVHPITTSVVNSGGGDTATHWIIQLIDLSDMSILDSQIVFTSNYLATGLSANVVGGNDYRFTIVGISDLGAASEPLIVDFTTVMPLVSESKTATVSEEQALDQFYITASHLYDEYENFVILFGGASEAFDTVECTFDGAPLALTVDDLQFTSGEIETDPSGATVSPPTYPADVEILPTDYTGASTAAASSSATLTISDVPTTYYGLNNPGKPSFRYATGDLAGTHTHIWNNSEIVIPDNGSKADVVARITVSIDITLTLVKNGDYANPLVTASSTPVDIDTVTWYQCDISLSDIAVAGGDHFELSMNIVGDVPFLQIAHDPTRTFFTLTVTEVYV